MVCVHAPKRNGFIYQLEPIKGEQMDNTPEIRIVAEDEFLARMGTGGRITVPLPYRQSMNIAQGDRVRVKLWVDV